MQSKKINELATNLIPAISDLVTIGNPSTGELKKITLNQIASLFGSVGGVSSVGMTVPTGLTVTGSPITTSGTLAVSLTSGYSIPTTAKQTEWDAGYSERLKWDGGASGLNVSTARSSLGLIIGTDVLAYRTFGSAANNNTGDFATASQGSNADTAYSLRLTGASLPLSISGNIISIAQSSSTINGFLSSTDFNTFNAKQQALNGTGFVKASGTSITYDNSTYLTTSAAASTYLTISNASSTYLPLSGGTLTGSLNGTSIILSSSISATQGLFTNTTSVINGDQSSARLIISNTGSGGQAVNLIAGNPNVDQTGFSIAYGNTKFLRFDSTGAATFSSLVTASSLIKSGGTSSQFLKADGSIDSSAYITLTSLSAVNPLFYNSTYGTFSINQANTSTSGYVSSTDWNTFNNKQPAGAYLTANQNIFFNPSGDVTGSSNGSTTLNPILTLASITQGGGGNFVKINIDSKGRVTGNSSVTQANIIDVLGYTPYNSSNPSGYVTSSGSVNYANSAGSISGYNNPTTAGSASTIAYRDSNGYLYAIAFFESSDIRFKNVLETNPKIDLNGIEVIKFNRKDNASIRYGYSAQQVKEFLPEAVSGDSELVVNYSDVHTLKIAALERRILELENKLK